MRDNTEAELDEEKEVPGQGTAKNTPHLICLICTTKNLSPLKLLLNPLLSYSIEPLKVNLVTNWVWGINR